MRRLALPVAALTVVAGATAALAAPKPLAGPPGAITLAPVGTYASGLFDESAAEIVAHDPGTQTLFVVNAEAGAVDVLDIADPTTPTLVGTIGGGGGAANSVAVAKGVVAVVTAADDLVSPGELVLYAAAAAVADPGGVRPLATLGVGSNPDMVTFTPNGRTLLVANEGEPSGYRDGDVDPEGSISIVDLRGPLERLTDADVRTADFHAFDADGVEGVRVFGPGASFSQDMEPEYITVSRDGRTAYVALQENNALATVDVRTATVTDVVPLGSKDHGLPGNGLDASDRDGVIAIAPRPVRGLYMPDAIAGYRVGGQDYVVTANEGDAREYAGFEEEARVRDLDLCTDVFADDVAGSDQLGRLTVTTTLGQRDGEDCFEELYSFGARSFSIFTPDGELVWDSGDALERTIADAIDAGELPAFAFNANNDENVADDEDNELDVPSESRSDNKGPEPEGIVLGRIGSRTFAFVGLERVGGVSIWDVTDPTAPTFSDYVTTRDFGPAADTAAAGDLGPEGLAFIAAHDSPTGRPLLAVGNEVSGTTILFEVVPAG
jgi:DNA-binding beta-propeller fold protein YncE